ncbi:mucin-binding protein [Limosilactobacillus vaginalis]|uniref:mucin-binding protein n=2 Tax=Limosilactobacillus vaginalis TaxID=1633 RepID=UPI0022E8D596|nr:MucBP domain-containing protein [Limosilactobacillus vaginalis]
MDPTYGSNSYKQNDTAAQTEPISFWASAIPQETSTKVRYVDQATGKDIVQPMEISGFGYQGFKVKGEAPTVKGYHLVSKPEFLTSKASAYEDGTISPYKVGQTYDLALSDSVVIKQTVINTDGTVRATAYYKGSRIPSTSASKVLGRESYNDKMSFGAPDGKFYTYTNRIGQVDDSYIYYYAKDSDPNGSEMRLHFIDVTGVNNSSYAPSDGPELDVDNQTIHGNIGENYSFTYTVPKGYDQVAASGVTGTYSKTHHDAYVYVKKHATQSVKDSKTVTRTINYTDPTTGEVKTLTTQPVTLTRTGSTDLVTHKTTWQDWTTGNWAAISANDIPTFAGYTPSQTSVAAETVTGQTSNSTVNITYTAGEQTVTIKFVDDNNGGQPVTSVTKAGQTGETINQLGLTMPLHYELAKGQTLPTSYTFTADKDQAITIHLIHATKTVDGNKPDTILSDVDKKQLIHTVTRTITDHVPGQEPLITKQSATITRRATYDEVTGKLSNFSDWTTAELPGYTAKGAAGYTASETDVPAETVTSDTKDEVISITYTANTQTGKISYQDKDGKEISTTPLSGKTDETVAINPQAPTGWKITDGQNIPKTVTATADGVPTVVVKIEHATTKVPHTDPVKPGAKTPTGKVIDGAYEADLNQTITRTINVTTPDGKTTTTTQVAKIYRDATYDNVTGEVTYGKWSTDTWKAFTPTAIPGYTVETVPVVEVKNGQRDVTVNVTYTAKNIQNIIKYVDENGNVVKTDTVTGKLGDPIKVTIPTGYHVADGKLPTLTIGDGARSVQTVHVIKDQHNTDNPIVDHKDVLNIIKYVDENGNVVKTDHVTGKLGDPIKVTIPDGYHVADGQLPTLTIGDGAKSVQTVHVIKDQHNTDNPIVDHKDVLNIIKYVDENGNVVKTDHVTGKLGDPITITIPAGYHVKDGKLPTLTIGDGAKSVQTVHVIKDQHNTDNPIVDHKDVLNIIKYVDENGNVVKTDTVTGHVGDPMSEATTSGSKQQAQQLPQTGNARHESGLAALGLALLGLIGLVPKKRRHDN